MMLRPTESRVMWLQQIGRGLRLREGKVLKVIDYIGNHRSFLMKSQVLLGSLCDLRRPWSHAELRIAIEEAGRGDLGLAERHRDWFVELERTTMTKSYKMLVLQAMLALDSFPGAVTLDALTDMFARLARRGPRLAADVACDHTDAAAVRAHLRKNPIHAWTGGFTGKGSRWFAVSDGVRRFLPEVDAADREAFVAVVDELVAWRLADYLRGAAVEEGGEGGVRRFVSRSGDQSVR